jgi:hypothetical protein
MIVKKVILSGILAAVCAMSSVQAKELNFARIYLAIDYADQEIALTNHYYQSMKRQAKDALKDDYASVKKHFKAVVALVTESEMFKKYMLKVINGNVDAIIMDKDKEFKIILEEEFHAFLNNVQTIVQNNLDQDLCVNEAAGCFFDAMMQSALIIPVDEQVAKELRLRIAGL